MSTKYYPWDWVTALIYSKKKISNLFWDLEIVREYIDDLLITSNGSLQDHLDKVEWVLEGLPNTGLKVNTNKSKCCRTKVEYLGYLITRKRN